MEALNAPRHRELVLKALSEVPIATTKQLATLNQSLDPRKKASRILRELEKERLITHRQHGLEKMWLLKGTRMRLPTKIDHAISVINLYFSLSPSHWMYEPKESYAEQVWSPDCIFSFKRKVYVCEVQLSPLSKRRWEAKWSHFNDYFNEGHFHDAAFQKWSSKVILPQFLAVTRQSPEIVKNGFAITGRDLIVCREFKGRN